MSNVTDILTGVATLLAANSVGTYSTAGEYTDAETLPGVTMMDMPAHPDRVITLTVVPVIDDPVQPLGTVLIQLAMRGAPGVPLDVVQIADAAAGVLHGLRGSFFGGVQVVQLLRHGVIPMGQDQDLRWLRTDHYYATVYYPATANQPDGGWD